MSNLFSDFIFTSNSEGGEFFETEDLFDNTIQKELHGVLDTVNDGTRIDGNAVEELRNDILFLDELNVGQRFLGEFDSLVKTIFTTVGNIDNLDDLLSKTRVEHLSSAQFVLEITRTSQDQTLDVNFILRNESLGSDFTNLSKIVVSLFNSETGETNG